MFNYSGGSLNATRERKALPTVPSDGIFLEFSVLLLGLRLFL